ncbi:MAG TPA: NADH-quinone oxidoreductase subunit A [Bacillota bacterium]|nr:NADH-quinone oxidoreductase subunit A [Bacillota bacterium]
MSKYVDILVFALAGALFPALNVVAAKLLHRDYPDPDKQMSYESGEIPFGDARVKYSIHWYIFALAFLAFDVESIFLYPWAVVYQHLSRGAALAEMAAFIVMLLIGLVYAVKKKVLTWV